MHVLGCDFYHSNFLAVRLLRRDFSYSFWVYIAETLNSYGVPALKTLIQTPTHTSHAYRLKEQFLPGEILPIFTACDMYWVYLAKT